MLGLAQDPVAAASARRVNSCFAPGDSIVRLKFQVRTIRRTIGGWEPNV